MVKKLIVLIGVPSTGKSTYRKMMRLNNVICPDEIRRLKFGVKFDEKIEPMVWKFVFNEIKSYLNKSQTCVIDATNLKRERRYNYVRLSEKYNARLEAIVFDIPFERAFESNKMRGEKRVPDEVMLSMKKDWDMLKPNIYNTLRSEGFNKVSVINSTLNKIHSKLAKVFD